MLQYLQLLRGDSPLKGSLSVLPLAVAMIPTARLSPTLAARFGARQVCVVGLVLVAAGMALMAQLDDHLVLVLRRRAAGAGRRDGRGDDAGHPWITESLPKAQQGVASALNDLSREVGGAIGIAVIGSILAAGYRSNIDSSGLPAPVAEKARISIAVASKMGGPVADKGQAAFVDGMHSAFTFGAVVAIVAAGTIAFLLRHGEQEDAVTAESRPGRCCCQLLGVPESEVCSRGRERTVRFRAVSWFRMGEDLAGLPRTNSRSSQTTRQCCRWSTKSLTRRSST